MTIRIGDVVMLPGYAPYPRYGRVAAIVENEQVRVAQVECGDPRCVSEHRHQDQVWLIAELESARNYQPRASWELGRKSSPNATEIS